MYRLFLHCLYSHVYQRFVKGILRPAPSLVTWDKAALKRSLSEVKNFSFDWVCPAHGEPVHRGNLWDTLVERQ